MTIDSINMRALPPVNVGVQQDSRVCGQFGQMDHFGLLLDTLTFVYPHIWQSDTHTDTHTHLSRLGRFASSFKAHQRVVGGVVARPVPPG